MKSQISVGNNFRCNFIKQNKTMFLFTCFQMFLLKYLFVLGEEIIFKHKVSYSFYVKSSFNNYYLKLIQMTI